MEEKKTDQHLQASMLAYHGNRKLENLPFSLSRVFWILYQCLEIFFTCRQLVGKKQMFVFVYSHKSLDTKVFGKGKNQQQQHTVFLQNLCF